MAIRVQRRRTKGWKMPENTVYVGRGSKFGNPWRVSLCPTMPNLSITAKIAVASYADLLKARQDAFERSGRKFDGLPYYEEIRTALGGKNLVCWCAEGKPCHADVLLEIANAKACGDSSPEEK